MREILFRGKRRDNGEWIEGSLVCYHDIISIIVHDEQRYSRYKELPSFKVIPETVGQYTGLTDKNGTKIFEGDIIKYRLAYNNEKETGYVKWDKDSTMYIIGFADGTGDDIWSAAAKKGEVIGNLHDNPELLEGEQK